MTYGLSVCIATKLLFVRVICPGLFLCLLFDIFSCTFFDNFTFRKHCLFREKFLEKDFLHSKKLKKIICYVNASSAIAKPHTTQGASVWQLVVKTSNSRIVPSWHNSSKVLRPLPLSQFLQIAYVVIFRIFPKGKEQSRGESRYSEYYLYIICFQ